MIAALGDEPRAYTAEAIRAFVLERARPHGIQRAKSIVVAVRAFMRFLGASGRRPMGLEHAIPGFASWQLASVPRYLEPGEVERVIDACDGDGSLGLRDRAVVLLLARLALRAGEVAQLCFSDIDWRNGRIAVCGKSRRREWLPLPQEVCDPDLPEPRPGALECAWCVHVGPGPVAPADSRGRDSHRAKRAAPGRGQGAD
jgi:integrase